MTTKKTKSTIFHDNLASKYESEYSGYYWKLYFDITLNHIKKFLPKKKCNILDAGGGTGFWSRKLAKLGHKVTCTDIAQKMLDTGCSISEKEKLNKKIDFVNADIMDMRQFKDNSFDFVLAEGDPVGYCGDPNKAIKELSRVAKKGSYVVVSIDSFFSRMNKMVSRANFKELNMLEKNHQTTFPGGGYLEHDFTVEEFKSLFEENGLKVINIIGKPVFARSIPRDEVEKILSSKKIYDQILKLELRYNNEPSIIGMSSHIQIIGKKR